MCLSYYHVGVFPLFFTPTHYKGIPWVRKIPWRRKWQPTRVFLPGESYGQRSLAGYIACGVAKSQLCVPKVPNTWAGDEQRLGVGFGQLGLVAEHSVRCGESESYLPKLQRREQEEQRGQSASRAGWLEGSGVKAGDTAASPATRSGPGIVWASAHGNSFNGYHRTVSWSGKLINTGWSLRCQSQCWRSQ